MKCWLFSVASSVYPFTVREHWWLTYWWRHIYIYNVCSHYDNIETLTVFKKCPSLSALNVICDLDSAVRIDFRYVHLVKKALLCTPQTLKWRSSLLLVWLTGQKNEYVVSTMADSAAEKAGVRNGDRLIWINGVMASTLTQSMLFRIVRVRLPQSKASFVKQDVWCIEVT